MASPVPASIAPRGYAENCQLFHPYQPFEIHFREDWVVFSALLLGTKMPNMSLQNDLEQGFGKFTVKPSSIAVDSSFFG
jgi:hypothetical protein